jgi:hypothetical protein
MLPPVTPNFSALVEAADLNALLRAVDGLVASRDWDDLIELADRCEEAVDRGKQLWPIAAHIDYRLALEAPGEYAAQVLAQPTSRFSAGPLTEVAASTHSWSELASEIELPQAAAYVAQERVLRGEVLVGDERAHLEVLEMPGALAKWEPSYALATYKATYVEVAEPWSGAVGLHVATAAPAPESDDQEAVDALLALVEPWTNESNGAARAVVVEGGGLEAAAALSFGSLRAAPLEGGLGVQRMAWAAASGGAHGRRRGAALGRFLAWYTVSLLAGLEWPCDPQDLGKAVARLRWFEWDEGAEEEGWVLRLALEDPVDGWGAAVAATDLLEGGPGSKTQILIS